MNNVVVKVKCGWLLDLPACTGQQRLCSLEHDPGGGLIVPKCIWGVPGLLPPHCKAFARCCMDGMRLRAQVLCQSVS